MVIDGPTLSRVLGTRAEGRLARLAARCSGVVVCRASPAQKAAIVRLMARYELFDEQARPTPVQCFFLLLPTKYNLSRMAAVVRLMALYVLWQAGAPGARPKLQCLSWLEWTFYARE